MLLDWIHLRKTVNQIQNLIKYQMWMVGKSQGWTRLNRCLMGMKVSDVDGREVKVGRD